MASSRKRQSSPAMSSQKHRKRTTSDSKAAADPSDIPLAHESVELPLQVIVSENRGEILKDLQALIGSKDNNSDFKYPIMIGSRAAAFWIPSFRVPDDWDLVATPQQAFDMLNGMLVQDLLDISLIRQPLDKNVIRRRPMKTEIQEKLNLFPEYLYKVRGEVKGGLKFEIEITPVEERSAGDTYGSMLKTTSAGHLFDICGANDNTDVTFMKFPVGSKQGYQCIVASVYVLEALKCSHIHWPAYFPKHIADIHTFRVALPPSPHANVGLFADKNKPLTAPERTPQLEAFLLIRTLETEAFRGTPGAHINLNVSNQDFLERDDDLFITRHLPHDDVHALVKYGDTPIYDQLKTDKSKAMVSKELFEKAPYDIQIKCVKEEAMVIALERFLLPGLSTDPLTAYRFALVRICTTLTKGWFRDFAIDNYPRLATCDKSLLPVRDDILQKHPLPPKERHDPMEIIKKTVSNLDDLVILQKLISLTEQTSIASVQQEVDSLERGIESESSDYFDEDEYSEGSSEEDNYCLENQHNYQEECWTIQSCNSQNDSLVVTFINESYYNTTSCIPSNDFYATISVQPLNENTQLKRNDLREYYYSKTDHCMRHSDFQSFHKLALSVNSTGYNGSWGVKDIWGKPETDCDELTEEVELLDLEGLTEDLLMTYLIAVIQPKLNADGEVPFVNEINRCKSDGKIPVTPKNHLWIDLWRLHV